MTNAYIKNFQNILPGPCQASRNVTKYMTARFHEISVNIFKDNKCIPDFYPTLYIFHTYNFNLYTHKYKLFYYSLP
jgi:hypothetical protein